MRREDCTRWAYCFICVFFFRIWRIRCTLLSRDGVRCWRISTTPEAPNAAAKHQHLPPNFLPCLFTFASFQVHLQSHRPLPSLLFTCSFAFFCSVFPLLWLPQCCRVTECHNWIASISTLFTRFCTWTSHSQWVHLFQLHISDHVGQCLIPNCFSWNGGISRREKQPGCEIVHSKEACAIRWLSKTCEESAPFFLEGADNGLSQKWHSSCLR